jgi:hypothetical protein
MTTVYLAVKGYDYEGEDVIAVCSTRDAALDALADRCVDLEPDGSAETYGDTLAIDVWEVDGASTRERADRLDLIDRKRRIAKGATP